MPITKNAYLRYELIDKLISKGTYTREKLHLKLKQLLNDDKLSQSTIDKDIKFLSNHFEVPIKYKKNIGYYYADPDFSLMFNLNKSEQRALEFAVEVMDKPVSTFLHQEAQTIVNKIYRRINKSTGDSRIISSDASIKVEGENWLSPLYDAIKDKKCIIIEYNSPRQKKIVKHNFSPYLLKQYREMWYVIGYSDQKDFTIVMALDRIKNVRAAYVNFHNDPDFSPEKYFKYSFGITHRQFNKPEKVKFWVDKDAYYYMKVRPLHKSQKVLQETDDGFIVQLEVYLSEELLITLMGLGSRVKVLEPEELVKDIRQHLVEMNAYYK
jgi:predicted DNA-binding transcriptional regulator YafY